jgi:histidyl-tRNA synthetase
MLKAGGRRLIVGGSRRKTVFTAPRGTVDVLPEEQRYWDYVRRHLAQVSQLFGYERIDPPVFEQASLYIRGTGDSTDIVRKEMYLFEDRGGEQMALRPEMTPGVVRAYLQHGLFNLPQPVKLYYEGPAFRYERPQAGRNRQFNQIDIEALGEGDPAIDAEVIEHGWRLLEAMGLRGLVILLNSIGDQNCRPAYIERLRGYYRDKLDEVCRDCRERFEHNPLRLLDCKVPSCQPVIAGAPVLLDNLCDACREHFARVRSYLDSEAIPYRVSPRLVRGLDYYTRTVFEIMPETGGSTSTILAGGRYDGLIEILGGKPTPGVGYASGIERIVINLKHQAVSVPTPPRPSIYVLHAVEAAALRERAELEAVILTSRLRRAGVDTLQSYGERSLKSQMRLAGKSGARYAVVVDDEALTTGAALLRDLEGHEQQRLSLADLPERLKNQAWPAISTTSVPAEPVI